MTRADLSVIMPAFDTEAYIGEAIVSVLEKADRLLELIVVDDGSTDATAATAEAFDERVRVIRQPNGGPANARNTALREARGAFVGFADSDDIWAAGRPDPRLAVLDADPGVAGAYGHARFFVARPDGSRQLVLEPLLAAEMPTLILRRQVLQSIGGFDEAFAMAEDMDCISRMREAGHTLVRLDDELVFLDRLRPGSLTRDREAVLGGWMQAGRAAMQRKREREGTEP